jgi:hypothetical protein
LWSWVRAHGGRFLIFFVFVTFLSIFFVYVADLSVLIYFSSSFIFMTNLFIRPDFFCPASTTAVYAVNSKVYNGVYFYLVQKKKKMNMCASFY